MKYVDSNVFIYAVLADEATEPKARLAKQILTRIADGRLIAATSSLTWDEVVWSIRGELGGRIAMEEGARFLEFPNLTLLNVDEKTIRRAQRIMAESGMKPRDAIHLACCIEGGMDEIISDDRDFDVAKEVKRLPLEKA